MARKLKKLYIILAVAGCVFIGGGIYLDIKTDSVFSSAFIGCGSFLASSGLYRLIRTLRDPQQAERDWKGEIDEREVAIRNKAAFATLMIIDVLGLATAIGLMLSRSYFWYSLGILAFLAFNLGLFTLLSFCFKRKA